MLSTTSIAFDFSIAELIWPLTRGYTAVLHTDGFEKTAVGRSSRHPDKPIDFSLFFWTAPGSGPSSGSDSRQLVVDAAHFAEEHGFAVWSSERRPDSPGDFSEHGSAVSVTPSANAKNVTIRAQGGSQAERPSRIVSPRDPELLSPRGTRRRDGPDAALGRVRGDSRPEHRALPADVDAVRTRRTRARRSHPAHVGRR